jgi:anaerobic selenocysteine-containing dehydrogenase
MKNHVFCQPKALEPVPECRDEKQILVDLARVMKLDGYWSSVTDILDYRLEPVGVTYEAFKTMGQFKTPVQYKQYEGKGGFKTPSRKVELHADYLALMGISPLPVFREPDEGPAASPDLLDDYPLILTTGGRNIVFYHSSHRNIPSLKKRSPDPLLQIHPDTAKAMNLEPGEWVRVRSPRGAAEIRIDYDSDMHPKVVHAPHGYWYGVEDGWKRLNINMLTDDSRLCPVTGSVPIKALLCRIEKLGKEERI